MSEILANFLHSSLEPQQISAQPHRRLVATKQLPQTISYNDINTPVTGLTKARLRYSQLSSHEDSITKKLVYQRPYKLLSRQMSHCFADKIA